MTREVRGETFRMRHWSVVDGPMVNWSFTDCRFEHCSVVRLLGESEKLIEVTGVEIANCTVIGRLAIADASLSDVTVSRLSGSLHIWNTVIKRATFSGMIRTLDIDSRERLDALDDVDSITAAEIPSVDNVDWALDISAAAFKLVSLRGVDPSRVRIDPARQIRLWRSQLLTLPLPWLEATARESGVASAGFLVARGISPSTVACAQQKTLEADTKFIQQLRAEGIDEW